MIICVIAVIALVFLVIMFKILSSNEATSKQKEQAKVEAQFTPEQLKFIKTVKELYKNNEAKQMLDTYVACGMPAEVAYSKDPKLIERHTPFEKGSELYNVFFTYLITVNKRFHLKNYKLLDMSASIPGINLHRGEAIYHAIYRTALLEEKTTIRNIAYSGVMWRSGLLRAGNLSVISNEVTRFSQLDFGKVLFTDERIIFIGKQKNVTRQIKINDILSCNLYQDGVIVNVPNKKPLLFKFETYEDFEIYDVSDQMNQFILVVNRIMARNYDIDLVEDPINVYASAKNIADILKQKNYDTMIGDVIKEAKLGETIAASTILRKFSVNYSRAYSIFEQLKSIGLINENKEWTVNAGDTDAIVKSIEAAQPNSESLEDSTQPIS